MTKASVICTVRNQAESLPALHEHLYQGLRALAGRYQLEIIYVDQASTDGTLTQLQAVADADPRVRVLGIARPLHAESAVAAGLERAGGAWVVVVDGATEGVAETVVRLLEGANPQVDAVVGLAAMSVASGWLRRLSRRVLAGMCERVPPAAALGAVALSRRAVDTLLAIPDRQRSLLGLVYWLDLPRLETTVAAATHGPMGTLAGAVDHTLAFSRAPVRWLGGAGLLVMAIGAFLALWFPVQGLLRPGTVWFSWCYLIVSLHLIGGGILAGLGLVGAYLVRVLEQVKQRPLYVLTYDSQPAVPESKPLAQNAAA